MRGALALQANARESCLQLSLDGETLKCPLLRLEGDCTHPARPATVQKQQFVTAPPAEPAFLVAAGVFLYWCPEVLDVKAPTARGEKGSQHA